MTKEELYALSKAELVERLFDLTNRVEDIVDRFKDFEINTKEIMKRDEYLNAEIAYSKLMYEVKMKEFDQRMKDLSSK